jgi:hypothetical protein
MLNLQLVYVRVEDLVHEAYTGRLVWELLGQLDVDLPDTVGEGRCTSGQHCTDKHEAVASAKAAREQSSGAGKLPLTF